MNKRYLVEGLQAVEPQIIELLERLDGIGDNLLQIATGEHPEQTRLQIMATTLHREVMQLRGLYQSVVCKTALLGQTAGGKK